LFVSALGYRTQYKGCTYLPKYDWKKPTAEENWESSSNSDSEEVNQQERLLPTEIDLTETYAVATVQGTYNA
jgi:hypothetical protein